MNPTQVDLRGQDSLKISDYMPPPSSAESAECESADAVPPGVEMILSAMDAGTCALANRRRRRRTIYRSRCDLRLFSDGPNANPWTIYTRDVDERGVGFISPQRLPLGYAGYVQLKTPQGRSIRVHCTLIRCREAAPGWYEGAAYFNREQHEFAST